jgi:dTDP-4-amino-4,6-dideoxygalactose transaminase
MLESILCANPKAQFKAYEKEISESIVRVLNSGNYILGEEVSNFESEFASYVGKKYCIGVNSGTDALVLALKALNIQYGDEVITVSHTAVATVAAICSVGAKPVFADVDPGLFTINTDSISKLITSATKAIIAVHLYGQPCLIDELVSIAGQNNLYLIEDCAQSHGARWKGKNVGSFGIVSCFSFYPTKNLGAIGDGGAVLTDNVELADRIRKLRQYGWDSNKISFEKATVSRLDEIQAAILRAKLPYLDQSNSKRREIANKYLSDIKNPKVVLPKVHPNSYHVFHLFVIQVPNRDSVIKLMNTAGIFPGIHYAFPAHKHPAFKSSDSIHNLPVTNSISQNILSLPMYPELSLFDVDRVISCINDI